MKLLMSRYLTTTTLAMTIMVPRAQAQTWLEIGDAGELVATAQSTVGMGSLTTITGVLDPILIGQDYDVDIYCINITNPSTFSATLVLGAGAYDFPLFLFDPTARGVTAQEGFYAGGSPSMITGQFVPTSGIYYLTMGSHDVYAEDASHHWLWNNQNAISFGIESQPSNPNALAQWDMQGGGYITYEIHLTGADYGNCGPVATDQMSWSRVKALYR